MSSVLNRNKMKLNAYKSDAPGCSHAEERYYIFKYTFLRFSKKNNFIEFNYYVSI